MQADKGIRYARFRVVNFGGVSLELHEVTRDSTAAAYSTFFQTQDFDMTKKGHRREVPVIITVRQHALCRDIEFFVRYEM